MSAADFAPAYPEIFLLVMIGVILIVDLFLDETRRDWTLALTMLTVAGCALLTAWDKFSWAGASLAGNPRAGMPVHTFHGMFVDDAMADVLKFGVYVSVVFALVYMRRHALERGLHRGEFYTLLLCAMLGSMVMISAASLITVYLGLELLSLSLYALVALQRDSIAATEAAMKYFILGALASGLLLYGMSMIYGVSHSLDLGRIAAAVDAGKANRALLLFGMVFIVAGVAFKLGAVPFHMWVPDVYHGAPTAVTVLLATAPKLAAFAMVMRVLGVGLGGLAIEWQGMLLILAVASLAIGNLAAIAQANLKRMLAYSAIANMGFMLLGVLSGVVGDSSVGTTNAYTAAMYYALIYVLTTLGAFGVILLLARQGFEADMLDDFKGLNARSPWFAFLMLLFMFSLAGIPPTVGFFAKLAVLQAVVKAGYLWLAVVAVLFSLIGAFYYLRVVKLMYFDAPQDQHPIRPELDMRLLLSFNGLLLLAFGIAPEPVLMLCSRAIFQSL